MIKFIIVVVWFCVATLVSNAEAIKDKDFEKFFTEFQKDLKQNKGDYETVRRYLDYSMLKRNCNSDEFDVYADMYLSEFLSFCAILKENYKEVCNLSAKNQYNIEKKQKNAKISWSIIYSSDEYNQEQYGTHSVYWLSYFFEGSGENEWGVNCIFAKIQGEWKIIHISFAG